AYAGRRAPPSFRVFAFRLCELCGLCVKRRHSSEQRIDEWRDGARLREDDQQSEQHEDDDDRHEPVFLLLPQEPPELRKHATFAHTVLNTSASSAADRDSAPDTASSRGWRGVCARADP